LSVDGLSAGRTPEVADLSFELSRGEVLGLAGLRDSGANVALRALAGATRLRAGHLDLGGSSYRPSSPREAFARGVAFLPADRSESVFGELSVLWNATLSSPPDRSRFGLIDRERERKVVATRAAEVRLKADTLDAPARTLSGGNQQKVALLRCLLAAPVLLLLEDPTRGIDVAAKAEIHALVRMLASRGVAVLLHSSELEQLTELCDRVLVLFRGRLVASLGPSELGRERLLAAMMGNPR
jgi:ABC-type sugar transport system ATPase subunit